MVTLLPTGVAEVILARARAFGAEDGVTSRSYSEALTRFARLKANGDSDDFGGSTLGNST